MAEMDACMAGRWVADTSHLTAFYQRLTPAPVTSVDGDIVMTLAEDGSGTGSIANFKIVQPVGGNTMINSGEGSFAVDASTDSSDFTINIVDFTVTIQAHMHVGNSPPKLMAEVTQGMNDLKDKTLTGTYNCDGGRLTLIDADPSKSLLPNWHR